MSLELETIKIKDIHPYERNARKNDQAVDAVVKSIEQCSYVAPIVVDENYVILAGHTRWKAIKKLGRTECECIVKSGLTEDQKKKYRLLDNKTNELADWDFDLLADELDGLDFGDMDIDWGIDLYPSEDECDEGEVENKEKSSVEIVVTFENVKELKKIESEIREIIDSKGANAKVRMADENIKSDKNGL